MKIRRNDRFVVRITKNDILVLFLIFLTLPHLNPLYFSQVPAADMLINGWRVISSVIIISIWLLRKRSLSIIAIAIGVQQLYLLANTVTRGGEWQKCLLSVVSVLSVVLLYDLTQKHQIIFLSAQLFCFELAIYLNLLSEIVFPGGMYTTRDTLFIASKNWFLGYYNNHSQYYIPALLIAFLYRRITGRRIRPYFLTGGIIISALLVRSGGVMFSLAGMAATYLFFKNYTLIFNYFSYWCLHILFFVCIVQMKLQNLFRWFIDDILDKWNSLKVRMDLWDRILMFVSASLFTGYGVEDGTVRELKTGFHFAMHAHNMLLEILYQGGIVNILLWIGIVVIAGRKLYQYRYTSESKLIATAFLGWCIATLVEPFTSPFLMGMFVIAYHSNAMPDCADTRY